MIRQVLAALRVPIRMLFATVVCLCLMRTTSAADSPAGFHFDDHADRLEIHLGSQRIATYLKSHPRLTRRALANVTTPSGIPITRRFPPQAPEDIDPGYRGEGGIVHPNMHPGIWISFGDLDGNDYWRLKAQVLFDGYTAPPQGDADSATFTTRNRYRHEIEDRDVCIETTQYEFHKTVRGLELLIDASFVSPDRDFSFGDQEESGLAIRVASPIRVQGGNGTILNDRGQKNGSEIWGHEAKWFDYFGTASGKIVGIMVIPDPANPRPSWLHARDYGLVATNPFPKQPKERQEAYVKTHVKRGVPFRLRYLLIIHENDATTEFDRDDAYADALERLKKR